MKQYEKLLYQVNAFPSALAMLFLVFNTLQTIFTLNNVDITIVGIRMMELILINIFLSFWVFVTAAEIKQYSLFWSYMGLGTGVFQFIRIFFISSTIPESVRMTITIFLLIAGFLLVTASLLSIRSSKNYRTALKE